MAKKEKKVKEELIKESDTNSFGVDIFKPMTLSQIKKIGTDNDPCFGKSYDLSTRECKQCGESELCSIKFSIYMNKVRKKENVNNDFKDIELEIDKEAMFKKIKKLKSKGKEKNQIIKSLMKMGDNVTEQMAKLVYRKYIKSIK